VGSALRTSEIEGEIMTTARLVTVFGGTGFLGRRIVRHLRNREYSVRTSATEAYRQQGVFAA
jgi:NADH dehydrogenase